ncbi:MAG: hypothetical protein EZS26_003311 [Candidatus Ordinivivax streblomastigis]|uniref:Uncharacterized protein n=1 Tax=Candidatus Ordinivivax streblomastigis TaxID=2540710 RepID=A0A5M8NXS1_9BACT|nr:MAG: hypothetical protein EZS26_003311 [Candidatus Ordinivivax streblomastigis]
MQSAGDKHDFFPLGSFIDIFPDFVVFYSVDFFILQSYVKKSFIVDSSIKCNFII